MNAPTPGWQPDPTGRHEHRYWDGSSWTDDVSDGGVASTDPMAGDAPTTAMDATQAYGAPAGPGGPGGPAGPGGPGYGTSSGQFPAAQPAKSGPSTGLIAGLAVAAIAVIALVVFLATSGGDDDDETSTDDTTEETTDDTSSDDTSSDDTSSDDTTPSDDPFGEDLDTGDFGDNNAGDMSDDAVVDALGTALAAEYDVLTEDQAQCIAQAMVDEVGLEGLIEAGSSDANPFESMDSEQQAAVITAMLNCAPADVLAQMGVEEGG